MREACNKQFAILTNYLSPRIFFVSEHLLDPHKPWLFFGWLSPLSPCFCFLKASLRDLVPLWRSLKYSLPL